MRHHNRLPLTALIAALASAYPMHVLANAGVTQFSVGDVSVQRAAANTPLSSGSRIESGDLITTGNTGRTQLRFTDGGMISLQPNSQFKISRYTDANDGKQDSFLVDLARGGMRALTGLIGKRNRDNYKVTTSTATIGIRGSGFSMAYNSDGTLGVTTEQDAIEVCTQGGCIGLNLGESALVTSAGAMPTRTNQRALWNPPNPRRLIGARNDDVGSDGKTATIKRVVTGLAFTGAGIQAEGATDGPRLYLNGATAITNTGESLGFRAANNDQGSGGSLIVQETRGSIAGGDFMAIGTWEGANWSGSSPALISESGFVIGQPTPENALAAASGMRGKYDLVAGTPVYSSPGASGSLLASSNVMVDFRSASREMNINLDVEMISNQQMPLGQSIPVSTPSGILNMRGSASATGSGFSSSLNIIDTFTGDNEGTGAASGFFGGPQAGAIGLSFTGNTESYGYLAGAGVFSRESNVISNLTNDGLGYKLHVLDGSNHFYFDDGVNNVFSAGEGATVKFQGTQLQNFVESNGVAVEATGKTARYYGSVGQLGQADFLGWGSWATANHLTNSTTPVTDVHYIVGKPTSSMQMPTTGSFNYSLIGASIPTSTLGGTGHLLSSSYLTVNFGDPYFQVNANLNVQFGLTQINISDQAQLSGSTFRSIGCGNGFVSGFFSGANAERAGLVYGKAGTAVGDIRGAAAFQRGIGAITPPSQ